MRLEAKAAVSELLLDPAAAIEIKTTPDRNKNNIMEPLVLEPVLADLARFNQELGPHHEKVAEAWNSLGLIRMHVQLDPFAAIECHKEALRIQRLQSCPSLKLAATLNDLAMCYERVRESERALELYLEAEIVLKRCAASSTHPVTISTDRCIARLQRR
ncbi:hypothetical protein ACA910_021601 [Epithemia clementina (nom. ined.)]